MNYIRFSFNCYSVGNNNLEKRWLDTIIYEKGKDMLFGIAADLP